MQQVTIETRITGIHFGCYAVVLSASGEILHETDVFPYGMPHVARRRAEDECLRRGWDDPSSERMRAVRAAEERIRRARARAQRFASTEMYERGKRVYIDSEGYVDGGNSQHETMRDARSVPGLLDAAIELRQALIAREQVV